MTSAVASPLSAPAEAAAIEAELIERQLCRRSIMALAERFTPNFIGGWFHEVLARELENFVAAVERKEGPRLIINAPPRHGKSQLTSRALPVWGAGLHPEWEWIIATYGQDLADDLGDWCKTTMLDPRYSAIWGRESVKKNTRARARMNLIGGGGMRFVGRNRSITGRGAHVIVVDDPLKNRAEADSPTIRKSMMAWYSSTILTRLAPGAGIIIMNTRWHVSDLTGELLKRAEDGEGEPFRVVSFPAVAEENETHRKKGEALHPERYSLDRLNVMRLGMLPRDWLALMQQRPTMETGNYLKLEWLRYGTPPKIDRVYIAVDVAASEEGVAKGDFWCIVVIGLDHVGRYWILDLRRGQWDTGKGTEEILDAADEWEPAVTWIEGGPVGRAFFPYFNKRRQERRSHWRAELVPHTWGGDKIAKSAGLCGVMATGNLFIPAQAPWIVPLKEEMATFPNGTKSPDQIDALGLAFHMIGRFQPGRAPTAGPQASGAISGAELARLAKLQQARQKNTRV